jgi:translation initiation factor 1
MSETRLVYSTESGSHCRDCGRKLSKCRCKPDSPGRGGERSRQGKPLVSLQRKGRGGKTVTVIEGLGLAETEMKALAKKLKAHCGTGGAVKNQTIEIQGDQVSRIKTILLGQPGADQD